MKKKRICLAVISAIISAIMLSACAATARAAQSPLSGKLTQVKKSEILVKCAETDMDKVEQEVLRVKDCLSMFEESPEKNTSVTLQKGAEKSQVDKKEVETYTEESGAEYDLCGDQCVMFNDVQQKTPSQKALTEEELISRAEQFLVKLSGRECYQLTGQSYAGFYECYSFHFVKKLGEFHTTDGANILITPDGRIKQFILPAAGEFDHVGDIGYTKEQVLEEFDRLIREFYHDDGEKKIKYEVTGLGLDKVEADKLSFMVAYVVEDESGGRGGHGFMLELPRR